MFLKCRLDHDQTNTTKLSPYNFTVLSKHSPSFWNVVVRVIQEPPPNYQCTTLSLSLLKCKGLWPEVQSLYNFTPSLSWHPRPFTWNVDLTMTGYMSAIWWWTTFSLLPANLLGYPYNNYLLLMFDSRSKHTGKLTKNVETINNYLKMAKNENVKVVMHTVAKCRRYKPVDLDSSSTETRWFSAITECPHAAQINPNLSGSVQVEPLRAARAKQKSRVTAATVNKIRGSH